MKNDISKSTVITALHRARKLYKMKEISEATGVPSVALSIFLSKDTLGPERLSALNTWLDNNGFYGSEEPTRVDPVMNNELPPRAQEQGESETVPGPELAVIPGIDEVPVPEEIPEGVSAVDLQVEVVADSVKKVMSEDMARIVFEDALIDLRNKERAVLDLLRSEYQDSSHLMGYPREAMEDVLRAESVYARLKYGSEYPVKTEED